MTSAIYLLKFNNRKTRKRCKICSKFTLRAPERRPNFEYVSHLLLVFLLLTFDKQILTEKLFQLQKTWRPYTEVLRPATLLKKRPWHRCLSCKFCKIVKNKYFIEHLQATNSTQKSQRKVFGGFRITMYLSKLSFFTLYMKGKNLHSRKYILEFSQTHSILSQVRFAFNLPQFFNVNWGWTKTF